ncbi:hypothetical protein [Legionella sp. km772]|uniref:hypothetical protein n=1 Tax=Legionella sp. km772 TaxID=2498111 RepID=UPI000F8F5A55|nr:hypothetical protein [Legionella sp. km772]RUR07523.1 hypothetical protein ELY15_12105 [Legionella sp. km772]
MRTNQRSIVPSWSALFAGALGGLGLNFLFNLLALAIGLACFSVDETGKTLFSLGGCLGFGFFTLLAMFLNGWLAGILSPRNLEAKAWGLLWGFLSWCILLVFTIILLMNMIQFLAFHSNFTSNLVAIKIQNNAPMLTETKAHGLKTSPLSFNIETNKKIITLNAFITFILFAMGAVASSIGGLAGYSCSKRNDFDD